MEPHPLWTSFLDTPDFAALAAVGCRPVKQVVGAYGGYAPRSRRSFSLSYGYGDSHGYNTRPEDGTWAPSYSDVLGSPKEFARKQREAKAKTLEWANRDMAINNAYETNWNDTLTPIYEAAQERLVKECIECGADGAVGIVPTIEVPSGLGGAWEPLQTSNAYSPFSEYCVTLAGTAVRFDTFRTAKPFTTTLTGVDTAALLSQGWIPRTAAIASVYTEGWVKKRIYRQIRWGLNNVESEFHTLLYTAARHALRDKIEETVKIDDAMLSLTAKEWLNISPPWSVDLTTLSGNGLGGGLNSSSTKYNVFFAAVQATAIVNTVKRLTFVQESTHPIATTLPLTQ